MSKTILKHDKYKKARGGYSRLLTISCQKCNEVICLYQKDGPGDLKRMYIDRISESKIALTRKDLSCNNSHLLGVKMIYEKEDRPAFRLFVGAVAKKIVKA